MLVFIIVNNIIVQSPCYLSTCHIAVLKMLFARFTKCWTPPLPPKTHPKYATVPTATVPIVP